MAENNKTTRIICMFLFLLIMILSILVCVWKVTWTITDRVQWFVTFVAAISIWKADYWGPKVGIWISLINIGYAVIELILIYSLDLRHYSLGMAAVYYNIPLIIMAGISFIICIKLNQAQKLKLKRDVLERKMKPPGKDGNCPKCGFSEIKFVDGVNYKCTRCGEIY